MAFDYSKLRGKIIEKYGSQNVFASKYGVSVNSLSRKMNNKTRFTSDDIVRISELLEIPKERVGEYFFTPKV
ncbi:DUF739 family protein [Gemmiger sp. An194]|uniref:DUF739 family protein n=1 Tax=Gemmiger sp. An194 TaxID=1965582 RepID=UPI000B370BDC|nr:DUF739 family protein [Gemmiger sp. An194]OUP19132.1 DUF739 domain-containing protein [Gemmiger sp. An194]